MFPAITRSISGKKCFPQVEENATDADLPPLSDSAMKAIDMLYNSQVRHHMHYLVNFEKSNWII